MSDINSTFEGLLRLFVLMLPVFGVLLLFAAAHVIGGALKSPRRTPQGDGDSVSQTMRGTPTAAGVESDENGSPNANAA